jgi:hypothetical protein
MDYRPAKAIVTNASKAPAKEETPTAAVEGVAWTIGDGR